MGAAFRLCICLLLAFAIISSTRDTISIPVSSCSYGLRTIPSTTHRDLKIKDKMVMREMQGRSMEMKLDDYGEATANHGHDPRNRAGGSRRSRDSP